MAISACQGMILGGLLLNVLVQYCGHLSRLWKQKLKSNCPPSPHPLDFDWRFTPETANEICEMLSSAEPTLTVGAPSIARQLERVGQEVLLVDRQPIQGVENQIKAEIGKELPLVGSFAQAVVDPPWYPNELKNWVTWTANSISKGGTIFVSIWPDDVRPQGPTEALNFTRWAERWADVEVLPTVLRYEEPPFERHALEFSKGFAFLKSPRRGRILKLTLRGVPDQIFHESSLNEKWVRFVLNDYQLAINLVREGDAIAPLSLHPHSVGWHWPYVSRRAPFRDLIGLWSSDNEVAIVHRPAELLDVLRVAFSQTHIKDFGDALGKFNALREWAIPRPPYERIIEWRHR